MNELKTIRKTLNNTTTEFKFDEVGAKFLIKNFSENDCYVGFDPTTIATNSVKISAGKAFLLMTDEYKPEGTRSVYVLGTGEVEVRMVLKYWRSGGKNTVFSGSQYFMNVNKSEGGGSDVVANPVLQGDEDALTGLEVDGTKYRIDNTTYQTFPSGWTTSGTIAQFCAAVNADSSAVEGMAYLGELRCSDLPTGLGNVEAVVEVVDGAGTSGKTIHITITSGNVSPYRWEYTYWNDGTNVSGWKTWLSTEGGTLTGDLDIGNHSIKNGTKAFLNEQGSVTYLGSTLDSVEIVTSSADNIKHYKGSSTYDILDTSNTQANPTLAGTEASLTGLKINGTSYKVDSGYTIHTYTINKTYTSADADYEQLRDDVTNLRTLQFNTYCFTCSDVLPSNVYRYVNEYDTGNNAFSVKVILITMNSNNVVVSTQADNTYRKVEANQVLAGTESNLTELTVQSTKYKLGYLPLSGGTMTGILKTSYGIQSENSNNIITSDNVATQIYIGQQNNSQLVELAVRGSGIGHAKVNKGGTSYELLDADNTSANPTLAGTETTLTSLKLNGTNYAIAGGTQVTFVDWS